MLTAKTVQALKANGGQYEVTDGQVPGLRLRISQDGTKTFTLLYRHRGKKRRMKIGRFPDIGLADARLKASEVLLDARSGIDPRAKKDKDFTTLKSVEDLVDAYITLYVKPNNKPSTIQGTSRILVKDIAGPWPDRDVRDITRADAADLIERIAIARSPFGASNALRAGRAFFNWLVRKHVIEASPFADLKDPAGIVKRERVLESRELAAIWQATYEIGAPWGSILRLLILSGRRRGEVVSANWNEFDWRANIWTIPAGRTKGSRTSYKPITEMMEAELDGLGKKEDGLIFPSQRQSSCNPVSGFSKVKVRLDKRSGIIDWRIHDIRRTVATNLAALGVADTIIARILDHRIVGIPDVTAVYNRHQYIPEMHDALKRWELQLGSIVGSRR